MSALKLPPYRHQDSTADPAHLSERIREEYAPVGFWKTYDPWPFAHRGEHARALRHEIGVRLAALRMVGR